MNVTYIILSVMLLSFTLVSYLYFYKNIGSSNYANYIHSLTFLATLFPLIIIIYEYQENNAELDKQKIQDIIRNMENDSITFENLFMNHYPYLARLYQQIYSDNKLANDLPLPSLSADDIKKRNFYETHVCSIMFQYIENTLLTRSAYQIKFDDPQFKEWVLNWKTWFQSVIVQEQWNSMKRYYGKDTQDFINYYIVGH